MMLLARCLKLEIDKPDLLNRVAQMLASGNKERAIILLEEDNHPISLLLSFTLSLSLNNLNEFKNAYEYAREEMRIRLTKGTSVLAWLTIVVPIITVLIWLLLPEKPSHFFNLILIWAIILEVLLWNSTLFYVKLKTMSILNRADDHFKFFSGIFIADKYDINEVNIEGLVDDTEDIVDIASGLETARVKSQKRSGKQL